MKIFRSQETTRFAKRRVPHRGRGRFLPSARRLVVLVSALSAVSSLCAFDAPSVSFASLRVAGNKVAGHSLPKGVHPMYSGPSLSRPTSPKSIPQNLPPCIVGFTGTPLVTSVSPNTGPREGGITIEIGGGDFAGCEATVTQVQSNSSTATNGNTTTVTTTTTTTQTQSDYVIDVYQILFSSAILKQEVAVNNYAWNELTVQSNTGISVVLPPGSPCDIGSDTVSVDAAVTSLAYTTTTTVTTVSTTVGSGPPVVTSQPPSITATAGLPNTTDTVSAPSPASSFEYLDASSQAASCGGTNGTPYDLANINPIVTRMSSELQSDTNAERSNDGESSLQRFPALDSVAASWADQLANGAQTSVGAEPDPSLLSEVESSGYQGQGGLWVGEDAGTFAGAQTTGTLDASLMSSGLGGTTGVTTEANMLNPSFSALGVAVACNGAAGGTCFGVEVFAGTGPPSETSAPQSVAGQGGTQALAVLPQVPTSVTQTAVSGAQGSHEIVVSWQPPPASGSDPVDGYAIMVTDTFTGIKTLSEVDPAATSVTMDGTIVDNTIVPVTTDAYSTTVYALNDLCQPINLCTPFATHPSAPPPNELSANSAYDCTQANVVGAVDCGMSSLPSAMSLPGHAYPSLIRPGPIPPNPGSPYWVCDANGGVYAFGNAGFFGSTGGIALRNHVVGMVATPDGQGYWLVASDGGIFAFGDASFFGSTGGISLVSPIVEMTASPDGKGYLMVAADGGVFAFGDALFRGSAAGIGTDGQVVGISATQDGLGYWVASSGGGVYPFGDAGSFGAADGSGGANSIIGIQATSDSKGYWLLQMNGGIASFGDATYSGSVASVPHTAPVVGLTSW